MPDTEPIEKRFIFHANAVAFAAHIRRPSDHQFLTVASSCLPVTGGKAEASAGKQDYQNVISFESASTSALGDFADARRAVDFTNGNHGQNELTTNTFVDSKLVGLRIAIPQDHAPNVAAKIRTFAVEQLHARLESTSDRRGQNVFRGLDAIVGGVTVDGHKLIVVTSTEVCTQHETYDKLVAAYQEDGKFRKQYGSLFFPTGHEKTGVAGMLSHKIPNANGLVYLTVVREMRWEGQPAPGTAIQGNRLKIEGIGSIYFGEVLLHHNARRLTLLRFQLGSPWGGEGSVCDIQSNGDTWPPQVSGN